MSYRATSSIFLSLTTAGLLLCAPSAFADEGVHLQAPINVAAPDQALVPHIDSLIMLPPRETTQIIAQERAHSAARAEHEISEVESAVQEAAEESQELQEEARDIDND
ncbi:hypothetical protein [Acidihalobacter aeolianus]|uniref:hypothetical protein n=1 Tax=Acidihalobacter aeolianus TaxID=2792603 RepID=UPI0012E9D9BC|nr:hypothetical protein [Acidihalobacter aeolianus]